MIENSNFLLKEIPKYNPVTQRYKYIDFWEEQAKRCIDGYTVGGKWMPGPLYYYVNFHPIEVEDKETKGMLLKTPFLRDVDWELGLLFEECRGFSGFKGDNITSNRYYGEEAERARILEYKLDDSLSYKKARDYLRELHPSHGVATYENQAKSFISMQSRGGGKSFHSSSLIAHNFNFGGATNYEAYKKNLENGQYTASQTIVGAIDTKYSDPLLDKTLTGLDNLAGSYTVNGIKYPHPLLLSYEGSKQPNKKLKNSHGSVIYHRTFKDNPFAGNGPRANLVVLDEIGFFTNIIESVGAIRAQDASKMFRNQVIWMLGTGGLVKGQAAVYAEKIFRNPDKYDCLAFEDEWEGKGSIGYFVPIIKTLNEFKKEPNLITDEEKALKSIELDREKARKSPDRQAIIIEMINRPLVPSEIFLSVDSNEFPSLEIKDQLAEVETNRSKWVDSNWVGHLKFTDEGEVYFESSDSEKPIRSFPLEGELKDGAIEIFEKPMNEFYSGKVYIMGCDTLDKDNSSTDSLFSVFVFNRYTRKLVAEYTGRKEKTSEMYEIARRLAIYYKATIMYEKQLIGLFTYFSKMKSTYLLAETPKHMQNTDTYKEGTNTAKGISASKNVNRDGRKFIKEWLLESLEIKNPDYRVINTIRSLPLLKELLLWNPDGNFDRVSALIMLMWYDQTLYLSERQKKKEDKIEEFLEHKYFDRFKKKIKSA